MASSLRATIANRIAANMSPLVARPSRGKSASAVRDMSRARAGSRFAISAAVVSKAPIAREFPSTDGLREQSSRTVTAPATSPVAIKVCATAACASMVWGRARCAASVDVSRNELGASTNASNRAPSGAGGISVGRVTEPALSARSSPSLRRVGTAGDVATAASAHRFSMDAPSPAPSTAVSRCASGSSASPKGSISAASARHSSANGSRLESAARPVASSRAASSERFAASIDARLPPPLPPPLPPRSFARPSSPTRSHARARIGAITESRPPATSSTSPRIVTSLASAAASAAAASNGNEAGSRERAASATLMASSANPKRASTRLRIASAVAPRPVCSRTVRI